jgi:D-beta-D-heptose 7-phosphate kinase/D-beta-D-heptose 1-phosphate adenosyltransferase
MTAHLDRIVAFEGARIVVLGDVMLDRYVLGDVKRISPEAPVPVFAIDGEDDRLGGAGNVARNIASLGGQATLIGVVGRDDAGAAIRRLAGETVGLMPRLVEDPARVTSVKTRFVASGQQLFRADSESTQDIGDAPAADLMAALATALPLALALVCSDYSKGVLTGDTLARAIALARSLGKPVIIDPKSRDLGRYAGATVITPNAREAAAATGVDCDTDHGVATAARRISEAIGGGIVVVTRGGRGMSVFEPDGGEGRVTHLPTQSREVHDVTGAGDTVIATLALAIATGAPLEAAVSLANAAAGLAVALHGTVAVEAPRLIASLQAAPIEPDGGKVVSVRTAASVAEAWRRQGLSVVFTNGCFDLLHRGHLSLLQFSRRQGDRLIVAINADASVRRLKGPERPVQSEAERASLMAAIGLVDLVTVFTEDTPMEAITAIRPDVLVKGADYAENEVVGGDFVQSLGGRVALAPLEAGVSTTGILRRARGPGASAPVGG